MAVYALWKREAMVRFPSFPTKFMSAVSDTRGLNGNALSGSIS
jgi:hypothetical protein